MEGAAIRRAAPGDADAIADILAKAFETDPVMNWTFRTPRMFRNIFYELARNIYLKDGFGHIADDVAATLWLPADAEMKFPVTTLARIGFYALANSGPGAVGRALKAADVMEANHPDGEHYYLFAVGVTPTAQGKGVGGRILREGLTLADKEGAPAYLENSNPKNTPLYERLGFVATTPLPLPAGAPPLLGMLRQGRLQ